MGNLLCMGLSVALYRAPSPRCAPDGDGGLICVHGDMLVLDDYLLLATIPIAPQGFYLRGEGSKQFGRPVRDAIVHLS